MVLLAICGCASQGPPGSPIRLVMDMHKTLFFLPVMALLWAIAPLPGQAQAIGSVQQDSRLTLQASEARTPVPPIAYRSAFTDLPQGLEQPPIDWKAANAMVGQFPRGHVDLLKWEQEQARKNTAPGAQP